MDARRDHRRNPRRGVLAVAFVCGAIAVALAFPQAAPTVGRLARRPPPLPAVAADFYGVNAQLALADDAQPGWPAAAAAIRRLGVGAVRRDAFWSAIEPRPPQRGRHSYRWAATDRLVGDLAARGLRWYPIVDFGTAWASDGDWEAPPTGAHLDDYAAFAGALARRYGRHGCFWALHPRLPRLPVRTYEIWNEPNLQRFWHSSEPAPAWLAAMYLDARAQIKTADRSARVAVGGLSVGGPGLTDPEQFLALMVRAHPRLVGHIDAVGLHPYGDTLQATYAAIRAMRRELGRLFGSRRVPIEVTEVGWAVPPVPETSRAAWLARLATDLPRSNCDVTRLIVHTWTSTESGTSPEAWYGIAQPNGALGPSAQAYRAAIATARRPARTTRRAIC
jgi:hypothetical protein